MKLQDDYDSQPTPSPSRSNSCGSGGKTVNFLSEMSVQSRSGGEDAIHTSGYEESQSSDCASVLVVVKEKKLDLKQA